MVGGVVSAADDGSKEKPDLTKQVDFDQLPFASNETHKFERRKFAANPAKMEISFAVMTRKNLDAMTKAVVAISPPAAPEITNLM